MGQQSRATAAPRLAVRHTSASAAPRSFPTEMPGVVISDFLVRRRVCVGPVWASG